MSQSSNELAATHRQARQFTELAFGLLALAALGFACFVHRDLLPVALADEARNVVSWSFVGLATLDATLLLVWSRLTAWIAGPN